MDLHNNTLNTNRGNNITIWQQNVNKSRICQHDLISSARLAETNIDIIALQEPPISDLNVTIASRDWRIIYPSTHSVDPSKTRSVILISMNILTDNWSQVNIDSGDVTIIKLTGVWGTLLIYNIYNDCEHDRTVELIDRFHRELDTDGPGRPNNSHTIWSGDFNRHHPHWDNVTDDRLFTPKAIEKGEKLIGVIADAGLDLALPPKIPTHKHNVSKKWTRLDHVFLSEHSFDALISCEVPTDTLGPNTDHLPVVTTLDLTLSKAPARNTANFRNVDWEKYRNTLKAKLQAIGPTRAIRNQGDLDQECSKLTKALQDMTKNVVPFTEIGPKSRRWWTLELTQLRRDANRLGRKASKLEDRPDDPAHTESDKAKKAYNKAIEFNKRNHWRDWLEKAEDPDIWTAHRYISAPASDGSATRIPTLKGTQNEEEERTASTNEEKSQMLAKTFFLKKPPDEPPAQDQYPAPVCDADLPEKEQIRRQLSKLKPYKAPGPDSIPNIVLTKCADLLIDRLHNIYKAIVTKGIYFKPWKEFTTVVLRKPGKPRYDVPKAYRPIALLNTMAKVLTAIIASQLMYYAEKHNLLPDNHFGGRARRTASDAVQLLVHRIKGEWCKGKVVSVLFLDIEGAFPNAVNKQLIHNLKTRRVPTIIVKFIANMLSDRSTTLRFDDHTSEPIPIDNGIGQGDPLSMALY